MPNMYEYFVARGLELPKQGGFFSFIVPDRLGFNAQFISLRKRILSNTAVLSLVYKVPFPGIIAETLIFVLQDVAPSSDHSVEIREYEREKQTHRQSEFLKTSDFRFEYRG